MPFASLPPWPGPIQRGVQVGKCSQCPKRKSRIHARRNHPVLRCARLAMYYFFLRQTRRERCCGEKPSLADPRSKFIDNTSVRENSARSPLSRLAMLCPQPVCVPPPEWFPRWRTQFGCTLSRDASQTAILQASAKRAVFHDDIVVAPLKYVCRCPGRIGPPGFPRRHRRGSIEVVTPISTWSPAQFSTTTSSWLH